MKKQLKTFIPEVILFTVGLIMGVIAILNLPYAFSSVKDKGLPDTFVGGPGELVLFVIALVVVFLCGLSLMTFSLFGIKYKEKKVWPHNVAFVTSIVFITTSVMIAIWFAIIFCR